MIIKFAPNETVTFGEVAGLMETCTMRISNEQPIGCESSVALLEWASCSIPMIKLGAKIIGEQNVINTLDCDDDYYEKLMGAGWDSNSTEWFIDFLKVAEALKTFQHWNGKND